MTYPHGGAGQIWRDGSPIAHNPEKSEIRDWGLDVEGRIVAVEAAVTGTARFTRDTLADVNAIASPAAGDTAYVLDDPGNTGTYEYGGASWSRVADLPASLTNLGILREELDGKSDVGHGHAIGDVPGLQSALDGKATAAQGGKADTALQQANMDSHKAAADQHPISGVTGLQADLDGKATAAQGAKADTALQQANMDSHKAAADQHPISGVTGLQVALDGKALSADLEGEVEGRKALLDAPTGLQSDALLEIPDAAGNILARVDKDAVWHLITAHLKRGDGLEVTTFDQNDVDGLVVVGSDGKVMFDSRALPDVLATNDGIEIRSFVRNGSSGAVVVDEAGNILAELEEADTAVLEATVAALESEIITARGDSESLGSRLLPSLSLEGQLRVPRVNRDAMRQMRLRQAQLRAGTEVQINHVLGGDSFTHNWTRWSGPFSEAMVARYGDGGGGWTGYGYQGNYAGPYATGGAQPALINGNARPDLYPVTYDGAWDRVTTSPSPDLIYITSSTPGDKITREVPAAPDHTALRLVWIATADGLVRWRIDGGNWTALNVQGTFDTIQWGDIPLTPGAHTVEIEVVAGTVKLCGDNALSDAPGYRVHKIARSGSRVSQWVAQDEAQQRAAWELLEANVWTYMEGTNSQTTPGQSTPADWRADMETMVARMRAASVEADICLFMPPDNQRPENAHEMSEYADQARDLAYAQNVAFLDAQPAFGPDRMAYAHDQPFPLFSDDLTHPGPASGGVQLTSVAVEFHDFHPTILS